ncbi:bifunctional ADP-dependent (S)-NAD(P)H-hydrate dehydratase/NAD(P)H-hydrate epimerase [Arcobacter sp. 31_11_sub10_T18]|nr:bifunctional ADP-dependent (S)-NAD(P)H-hydrate dehydratase/NAD(P)H-hydrate epimerase [Arcobacter sp. 31_11_sub10_T18]
MQKVFDEVNTLDKRCYEELGLSEDILMEHAANSMLEYIQNKFISNEKILIVCGAGNNGADGIALARLLYGKYDVSLYLPYGSKSYMSKLQHKRTQLLGIEIIEDLSTLGINHTPNIIVDCLFGSGLSRDLDSESQNLIKLLNSLYAHKISCDIPSGINDKGQITTTCFRANTTITMGALKTQLYTDRVKDYVGNILVSNLGIQRIHYETQSNTYLLDELDMEVPYRTIQNSHKGKYGHLSVIVGEKIGAGIIACEAAFSFGAGLVTAVSHENLNIPLHIMQNHTIPINCTALAIGMGLGRYESKEIQKIFDTDIAKVIDADLFYDEIILTILNKENIVLTPHPKEFCSLLKLCEICDISIDELQDNRFKYLRLFGEQYPQSVLLLKGANSLMTYENMIYINTLGTVALSKGGSGDVLSGLIASLLAQGYNGINACITASLAHSISASKYTKNNYALTPQDLIEGIKIL